MRGDEHAERRRFPHRLGKAGRVDHRAAVVAERCGPGLPERREVVQRLAGNALRNRRRHIDVRVGVLRLIEDVAHGFRRIDRGLRVRHAQQARHAAGRCRAAARQHVLLVGEAGVAQVHVQVDEAGHRREASGLDHLGLRVRRVRRNGAYAAVGDQDIADKVLPARRIDDPRAADQDLLCVLFHIVHPFLFKSRNFIVASSSRQTFFGSAYGLLTA